MFILVQYVIYPKDKINSFPTFLSYWYPVLLRNTSDYRNRLWTAFKRAWSAPASDLLLWVMLIGCSAMKGDWSDDRGGGARTWRPKRHFFFFISFPETNLYDRSKSDLIGIQLLFFRAHWQIFICSWASHACQLKHLIQLFKC